jgi:hypothetical protein
MIEQTSVPVRRTDMKDRIVAMLEQITDERKLERLYWYVVHLLVK